MKNVFLVLSFCFYFSAVAQHKIVFSKTDSSANVEVELKDNVKLSYSGYMGQPQEAEGIVTLLNDSIISLTPRKKLLQKKQPAQTLYVRDISGFRSTVVQAGRGDHLRSCWDWYCRNSYNHRRRSKYSCCVGVFIRCRNRRVNCRTKKCCSFNENKKSTWKRLDNAGTNTIES